MFMLLKDVLNHLLCVLIRIVESTDARMFGLDDAEVQRRRQYVVHVRKELEVQFPFQRGFQWISLIFGHPHLTDLTMSSQV